MSMAVNDNSLFPTLSGDQLAALAEYGEDRRFDDGEIFFSQGDTATALFVILDGRVKVTRAIGRETATLTVHEPGQFAGELALLNEQPYSATGVAVGDVRAISLTAATLKQAFAARADIEDLMLSAMANRKPEADAQLLQREKLAALGKLSAGLAHELNNPAAAISRASAQLREVAAGQLAQSLCLGGCPSGKEQAVKIVQMLEARVASAQLTPMSALQRSDAEDALADELEKRGVADGWKIAPELVASNVTLADLAGVAETVPVASLNDIAAWLAAAVSSLSLVTQIESSSWRLSEVIGAIKSYTYMDQATVQQVDVIGGIETTLTLLRHKLKGIDVARVFQDNLPKITGRGGELNQVWTNLIDNAVDAMNESGTLTISADSDADDVTVTISDTGGGIEPDVLPHVFEPFYTTKEIGKGTGLGLDTVYHIVVDEHRGQIDVQSVPGATTFTVRLPIASQLN